MKQFYKRKKITNKDKIIIFLIIILFVDIIIFKLISNKFNDNIVNIVNNKLEEINRYYLNNTIKKYLNINTNNYIKTNFVNNNIVNIDIDSNKSNKLLKSFLDDLENNVKKIESGKINKYYNLEYLYGNNCLIFLIPIGSVYKNVLISGLGPKIPIKATFLENIDSYIDVKVENYGINNSIIKLYIVINIKEVIEMPTNSANTSIKYKYLISSKLVNGKVPSYLGSSINNTSK